LTILKKYKELQKIFDKLNQDGSDHYEQLIVYYYHNGEILINKNYPSIVKNAIKYIIER